MTRGGRNGRNAGPASPSHHTASHHVASSLSDDSKTQALIASLSLPESVKSTALRLRTGDFTFSSTAEIDRSGQVPTRAYRKTIARCGDYVNDGVPFTITRKLLDHWVTQFSLMHERGIKVPIVNTHDGTGDPDQLRGDVRTVYRDDDDLVMTCEMIGDDAIMAASRCDVSIRSPISQDDGLGNTYIRPIEDVALCPNPVIPGMGCFIPIAIAASLRSNHMNWTGIAKAIGVEDGMTDANAQDKIVAAFKSRDTVLLSLVQKGLGTDDPLTVDNVEKTITDRRKALVDGAKQGETKPVDPMLLSLSRKNGEHTLAAVVTAGRMTPAIRKEATEHFLTDSALKLSIGTGRGLDELEFVAGLFQRNDPVELSKGHTGGQTLPLDDPLKTDGEKKNVLLSVCEKRGERDRKRTADLQPSR